MSRAEDDEIAVAMDAAKAAAPKTAKPPPKVPPPPSLLDTSKQAANWVKIPSMMKTEGQEVWRDLSAAIIREAARPAAQRTTRKPKRKPKAKRGKP